MSVFPILQVDDVERAATFYEQGLGFERAFRWPAEGAAEFVYLRRGEHGIGIGGDEPSLCVYVDDVDASAAALRGLGARELEPPSDRPWGERMALYESPDGHRVLLTMKL